MVGSLSIAAMSFSMVVPLGVFIVFLVHSLRRYKTGMKPILIGAGIFVIFALVLERLFHYYFLIWNSTTAAFFKNTIAYAVYGGLMAGIFEETGRLMGFKLFFKKTHEWKHGIAYGIGHGGFELIYIGVLTQFSNIVTSIMINNGTFAQTLKMVANMPAKTAALETVQKQLISPPSWEFLMAGIERIDAFMIQLALSVLVMYAVANHRYIFYVLAILLHAIVDFTSVFLGAKCAPLIVEGAITVFAIVSVIFVIRSRKLFHKAVSTPCGEQFAR